MKSKNISRVERAKKAQKKKNLCNNKYYFNLFAMYYYILIY